MKKTIIKVCRTIALAAAVVGLVINICYGDWLAMSINTATIIACL